jgi:hypothetical protein
MLYTCRQIHSETLLYPFTFGTFSFPDFATCQDLAGALDGDRRRLITSVEFGPDLNLKFGWYWFVRHVKENDGSHLRELMSGVKEVLVDRSYWAVDGTNQHWRLVLGNDALGMKGRLLSWLEGGEGKVEVRFGEVEKFE